MERATKAVVGDSGGRAATGRGTSGRGVSGMPDLAMHEIGQGRYADERDAVDRLPAGDSTADRHGCRAEANDTA